MKAYKTVSDYGETEFVERKSKFLSFVYPVTTEKEAVFHIEKARKKFYDSTHVVFAYKLRENNIARFSDDGEPQGTAGLPVLDVINKSGIEDVLIIVVRYFGGILLGAGGLVRAYSKSASLGVEEAVICTMTLCSVFEIKCPYNMLSQTQYILENHVAYKIDIEYMQDITLKYYIEEEKFEILKNDLFDKTNGVITAKQIANEFHKIT